MQTGSEKKVLFKISDKVYLRLKAFSLVVLPAVSTLYFTLGSIWSLASTEQVVGSIAAINTFFGVFLGISTKAYNNSDARFDGSIAIVESDKGEKLYSLELNDSPDTIDAKSSVTFRINPSK